MGLKIEYFCISDGRIHFSPNLTSIQMLKCKNVLKIAFI